MADKVMANIKSGKGLPPISSNTDNNNSSGIIREQREQGITYETFSYQKENSPNVVTREGDD